MLTVTANGSPVDVFRGDLVQDTIETSVGTVPFEWSTGFTAVAAIAAIEAHLDYDPETDEPPVDIESTGEGWILDLPSETHPQAEITDVDYVVGLINFKWSGGPYSGDCAVSFDFSLDTAPEQIAGAIVSVLGSSGQEN